MRRGGKKWKGGVQNEEGSKTEEFYSYPFTFSTTELFFILYWKGVNQIIQPCQSKNYMSQGQCNYYYYYLLLLYFTSVKNVFTIKMKMLKINKKPKKGITI